MTHTTRPDLQRMTTEELLALRAADMRALLRLEQDGRDACRALLAAVGLIALSLCAHSLGWTTLSVGLCVAGNILNLGTVILWNMRRHSEGHDDEES